MNTINVEFFDTVEFKFVKRPDDINSVFSYLHNKRISKLDSRKAINGETFDSIERYCRLALNKWNIFDTHSGLKAQKHLGELIYSYNEKYKLKISDYCEVEVNLEQLIKFYDKGAIAVDEEINNIDLFSLLVKSNSSNNRNKEELLFEYGFITLVQLLFVQAQAKLKDKDYNILYSSKWPAVVTACALFLSKAKIEIDNKALCLLLDDIYKEEIRLMAEEPGRLRYIERMKKAIAAVSNNKIA